MVEYPIVHTSSFILHGSGRVKRRFGRALGTAVGARSPPLPYLRSEKAKSGEFSKREIAFPCRVALGEMRFEDFFAEVGRLVVNPRQPCRSAK